MGKANVFALINVKPGESPRLRMLLRLREMLNVYASSE